MTNWDQLARWWIEEGVLDPVYNEDVVPMLRGLIGGRRGTFLDIGCGEGHLMETLDADSVIGCDITGALLRQAVLSAPVVRCRLPDLGWLKREAIDVAYAVFVIEHVADLAGVLAASHRVVRSSGALVVVANHPAYTAPGAGPVIDQSDGEVLWRWGPYFSETASREPVGPDTVVYHHRSLASLLTTAAECGWVLEELIELGLGPQTVAREPALVGQEHMPRLLGVRWRSQ